MQCFRKKLDCCVITSKGRGLNAGGGGATNVPPHLNEALVWTDFKIEAGTLMPVYQGWTVRLPLPLPPGSSFVHMNMYSDYHMVIFEGRIFRGLL
jgi:hypothetical protein